MGRFSHKRVVVGIIYDPERGFLLPYNDRWHHFAFVMKQVGDDQAVAQVAIDALKEDIRLRFPDAKATAVDRVGAYGISDRTGEENYYDYTVYLYDLGPTQGGTASSKDARFFAYEELLDDDDVSWNTKEIVQALVERREVVVAVISRQGRDRNGVLAGQLPSHAVLSALHSSQDGHPTRGGCGGSHSTGHRL